MKRSRDIGSGLKSDGLGRGLLMVSPPDADEVNDLTGEMLAALDQLTNIANEFADADAQLGAEPVLAEALEAVAKVERVHGAMLAHVAAQQARADRFAAVVPELQNRIGRLHQISASSPNAARSARMVDDQLPTLTRYVNNVRDALNLQSRKLSA